MRIAARLALETTGMSDGRQAQRNGVDLATTLRTLGYHGHDVSVRDISTLGFMAETDAEFPVGAHARLRVPGLGVVISRIVWASAGRVGGAFVTPLEPVRLSRALGFSGPVAQAG